MYLLWESGDGVDMKDTVPLRYLAIQPRIDQCTLRSPRSFKMAALHGLWYVHIVKLGTVFADSNLQPWKHYVLDAKWLVSLWAARKLSHEQFEEMSALFRVGHAGRMQELASVRRTERAVAVRRHLQRESANIVADWRLAMAAHVP